MTTPTLGKREVLAYLRALKERIDCDAAWRIAAMPDGRRWDRAVDGIEERATRDIRCVEAVEALIETYRPDEAAGEAQEEAA